MERGKVIREFRWSIFFQKSIINNPISTTLLLFCLCQWEVFPVWFCWPPYEREFEFESQLVNSTFLYTTHISLNLGKCMFKIPVTVGVSNLQGWRCSLPYMLDSFQSQLLMLGNMVDTCGDNLFLKFHHLLSLDGTCDPTLLMSKEKMRGLRFTSNPKVRVGLIMRKSLEGSFPLIMIANKGSKIR